MENSDQAFNNDADFWENSSLETEGDGPAKFPLHLNLDTDKHLLYHYTEDISFQDGDEKTEPSPAADSEPAPETATRAYFQDIRFFVAFACFFNFNVILLISALLVVMGSVQVRYDLTSLHVGLIGLMGLIGTVVALPFVTYFGGRPTARRPAWIAAGGLCIALGFATMLLPQIFDMKYNYDSPARSDLEKFRSGRHESEIGDLCVRSSPNQEQSPYRIISGDEDDCDEEKLKVIPDDGFAFLCLVAGAVVCGMGYAPVSTLMVSYIDDHGGDNAPVYIGLLESCWGIAPIVGYVLGALSLRLYVDFNRLDMSEIDMDPSDPRWVGAWWLVLAIGAGLVVLSAVPLLCFPSTLPKHSSPSTLETSQLVMSPVADSSDVSKEYWRTTGRLLTNSVLMVALFGYSIDRPVGFVFYLAQYLHKQDVFRPLLLNFIVVCVWLLPAVPACIFTGLIVKRLRQSLVGVSRLVIILSITAVMGAFLLVIFSFEGIALSAPDHVVAMSNKDLVSGCNANCGCSTERFHPVCGSDKMNYFSPCHAGCSQINADWGKIYTNCTCVNMKPIPPHGISVFWATEGPCDEYPVNNGSLAAFIIFAVIFAFASHGSRVPNMSIVMRSVHVRDKSFALGLHFIFVRLFSYIPGVLIASSLLNSACVVWQTTKCDRHENCVAFDNSAIRYSILALGGGASVIALLFYIALYVLIKRHKQPRHMIDFYERESKKGERIASYQKLQMITSI